MEIELDWRAYYLEFEKVHGGEPVDYAFDDNGKPHRILFRDGWMYAANDYQGPEYPPPDDPAKLLLFKTDYWKIRRGIVLDQLFSCTRQRDFLERLQTVKSAPLQQTSQSFDEEGKFVTHTQTVDLQVLVERIDWLGQDLLSCNQALSKLAEESHEPERHEAAKAGVGPLAPNPVSPL